MLYHLIINIYVSLSLLYVTQYIFAGQIVSYILTQKERHMYFNKSFLKFTWINNNPNPPFQIYIIKLRKDVKLMTQSLE